MYFCSIKNNQLFIMKKHLLLLFMTFMVGLLNAQVTGFVLDSKNGDPLIGASVLVRGTTIGTITDVDGSFSIMPNVDAGQLEISYLGYQTILVPFGSRNENLSNISLVEGFEGLEEVVISGVMDIVKDRRTPVAVSTITTAEIQAKAGNVEFPELMKNTPSIYVANQAGGYGDSEVFTRGFDQTNTAFLLNGQPINGMEDGKMYWSNWSGMTDVASAIQIQRGLGSSKLAISSVGGTTNIIMKATDKEKGGSIGFLYGNDNYLKATASYSTGMINDKFGVSVLLTHWQGDGWAEGTKGQGQNYFLSAGYKVNDRNTINFLITGAPQWHDQNYTKKLSSYFGPDGELNPKYNSNWGLRDGEYFTLRRNFYHKPVANLNWDFQINDKSKLSAVLYASWGRGGVTGGYGNYGLLEYKDRQIDWDATIANNQTNPDDPFIVRASVNNHSWYGAVLNYETMLSDNVTASIGTDLRSYRGTHFREVVDLLGAPSIRQGPTARFPNERFVTATFKPDPWAALTKYASNEERIAWSYDETIRYGGVYGQLEYANDMLSTFVQGSISNQAHQRFELRNATPENEASEKVSNLGYNIKTGASFSLDRNNTIFANAGYYQRQPFHDNIYLNYSNTVNPVTVPEKILGVEGGYKYSGSNLAVNVNAYLTSWKDRAKTSSLDPGEALPDGTELAEGGYRNSLQNQLHKGVELDFGYQMTDDLKLRGYASIGDWAYNGTLDSKYYDADRNLVFESTGEDVSGVKVGGAAQTTLGLGLKYQVMDGFNVNADYNFYDNLYSNVRVGTDQLKLPSFGLLDFGLAYNFDLGGNWMTLRANVFNVLGTTYISRSYTAVPASETEDENWNGVNKSNKVTFGKTRTWNVSLKYHF